jgi:hypothetical protein
MGAKYCLLSPGGPAGADDSDSVVVALCPHNQDQTAANGPDGNESILVIRVGIVKDLEMVRS